MEIGCLHMLPYILERLVLAVLGEGPEGRMVVAVGVDVTVVGHRVVLDSADEAQDVQELVAVVDRVQLVTHLVTDRVGRCVQSVELADHEVTEVLGVRESAVHDITDGLDHSQLVGGHLVVGDITLEANDFVVLGLDVEQEHDFPCVLVVTLDDEVADEPGDGEHHAEPNDETSDVTHGSLLLLFFVWLHFFQAMYYFQ